MMPRIVVYDKDGNPGYHHYEIDAREAIATGNWFARNPKANPVPAPEPEPQKTVDLGEDIDRGKPEEFEKEGSAPEPEFEIAGKGKRR